MVERCPDKTEVEGPIPSTRTKCAAPYLGAGKESEAGLAGGRGGGAAGFASTQKPVAVLPLAQSVPQARV